MKLATSLATALVAFSTAATADIQSKPFYLVALSDNDKINGTAFEACHEGAAIEGLCKGAKVETKPSYSTYHFNYTKNSPNYGEVTWNLQGTYSESLSLSYDPSSNVAIALFGIGDPTYFSFDKNNHLYIQQSIDDTVTPPKYLQKPRELCRWYMCTTYFLGYTYQALAWTLGKAPPQNPSCQKIEVVRVFK